jgi:hypothetical protein
MKLSVCFMLPIAFLGAGCTAPLSRATNRPRSHRSKRSRIADSSDIEEFRPAGVSVAARSATQLGTRSNWPSCQTCLILAIFAA